MHRNIAANPPPLSFAQALVSVAAQAALLLETSPAQEAVSLADSLGRVLAAPILADRDQPPFDRATRDGYAVRAADLVSGQPLRILGQVRAGEAWPGDQPPLASGQAIEIMTGAPMPAGADAVLMVEHAERSPDNATLRPATGRVLAPGANFVPRASEARNGDCLAAPGTRMGVPHIAVAAGCGLTSLSVYARPRVAILATGDELVEPASPAAPIAAHQIYNSNSDSTAALVQLAGAIPVRLPIARDRHQDIADGIRAGLDADLLLLSGGVSMGKYDLVEEVLTGFDAEFFFTGVRIQPGKPLVFGRIPAGNIPASNAHPARYFFGLPGNPLSTMVTFALFVRPLLAALAGEKDWQPPFALARLTQDFQHAPGLTRFLPAWLDTTQAEPTVTPVPWHGSGDLAANARANCYLVAPEDLPLVPAGTYVRVLLRG
ncbi:MAG TPA: gephyrin-like molybdotransferase Glp [Acidobacteriaceae bacterium]|nr:gephyrin-like molybdotransferase Glp [Acidobacteriaceae bacterium]